VRRVVDVTDVDGLFTKDPKLHKDAIMIEEVSAYDDLKNIKVEERGIDVSGRMINKIKECQPAAREGIECIIVNGLVENRVRDALLGMRVKGTLIFA